MRGRQPLSGCGCDWHCDRASPPPRRHWPASHFWGDPIQIPFISIQFLTSLWVGVMACSHPRDSAPPAGPLSAPLPLHRSLPPQATASWPTPSPSSPPPRPLIPVLNLPASPPPERQTTPLLAFLYGVVCVCVCLAHCFRFFVSLLQFLP